VKSRPTRTWNEKREHREVCESVIFSLHHHEVHGVEVLDLWKIYLNGERTRPQYWSCAVTIKTTSTSVCRCNCNGGGVSNRLTHSTRIGLWSRSMLSKWAHMMVVLFKRFKSVLRDFSPTIRKHFFNRPNRFSIFTRFEFSQVLNLNWDSVSWPLNGLSIRG